MVTLTVFVFDRRIETMLDISCAVIKHLEIGRIQDIKKTVVDCMWLMLGIEIKLQCNTAQLVESRRTCFGLPIYKVNYLGLSVCRNTCVHSST